MPNHNPCAITIAHINDTHSYFEPSLLQLSVNLPRGEISEPFISVGGFARIKSRADELKVQAEEKGRRFLFLHGGDCFQGTLYFSLFKGDVNADLLNQLNIDAIVLGNHELDLGNDTLASFAKKINFPLLAGNWDLSHEDLTKVNRLSDNPNVLALNKKQGTANYKIFYSGNEAIAVFGISLDQMADISNPDRDTPFVCAKQTIRSTVQLLNQAGVNKIILLSHLGYEADKNVALEIDGISLIVGGHSHVLQGDYSTLGLGHEDTYGQKVKQTYVVQSGLHSQAMGCCHIDFNADGSIQSFEGHNELLIGRRVFFKSNGVVTETASYQDEVKKIIHSHPGVRVVAKDPSLHHHLINHYTAEIRKHEAEKIALLPNELRHIRIPNDVCGSEVAPLVAKAFRYALSKRSIETDFAIHNAGGVRCSLPQGEITSADIGGKLLPFAIPIGRYTINGRTLSALLEGAIDNAMGKGALGTGSGSYPYCDGIRFQYDAENPEGSRISNVQVYRRDHWQSVLPDEKYYGTSTAYTMKGKEGYDAILCTEEPSIVTNISMADAFIEWLKQSQFSLNAI
jgi:5'-nucleotidase